MKRTILAVSVCALFAAGSVSAETQIYFGFQIGITNAPPPPKIVYTEAPEVVIIPDTKVYVVNRGHNDCDFFRHGKYWYVTTGGFWYRAGGYDGPFKVVDVRNVPEAIFAIPAKHWKHHPKGGPPGLAAKADGSDAHAKIQSGSKGKKGKKGKGH
jgi:hypothetical protein